MNSAAETASTQATSVAWSVVLSRHRRQKQSWIPTPKQLKLSDRSAEWEIFYDLAGAETGQIPKEALKSPSTVKNLPTLFAPFAVSVT